MGMEITVNSMEEMCDLMCDNKLPKRRRASASIFDPFRKEIETWCNQGMPVNAMVEILGEGYTVSGLYSYIHTHKLRSAPWKDVFDARNQCDKCEHCHVYINTNNKKGRICSKSWRVIQPCVRHSPVWCEKERGYEGAD